MSVVSRRCGPPPLVRLSRHIVMLMRVTACHSVRVLLHNSTRCALHAGRNARVMREQTGSQRDTPLDMVGI